MLKKIFILILTVSLFSCKQNTEKKESSHHSVSAQTGNILPPVPEKFIYKLYEEVDHIDYYFRNTNFSVSQDEKTATQAYITTLSASPPAMVNDSCRSPLRMTFLSNGNILAETEMYMSEDCQYIEYIIDGKKTYHANYSEQGYKFLINLFQQAQNVPRQN